ncbi:MAG: hypothetical protein JWN04_6572 [Myxococcaceae bacterium]|nr:hypothetical protein [Myxococcaceae bacterium]
MFARFAVHVFEGSITADDMDLMQLVGERWNAKHPGKRVELVVVFPSNTRLTHEERMRVAHLIKLGERYRAASATVILANGLLASMQRSVLTGMMMIVPPPHPVKVFSDVAAAVEWLFPHVQAVCGAAVELEELVHSLLDHLHKFEARPDRPKPQLG